jgi:YXWGXW repeat-containing protein
MKSEGNLEVFESLRTPHQNFPTNPCGRALSDSSESRLKNRRAWQAAACSVIGTLVLLLVATAVVAPATSYAVDIGISIRVGPPPLPVYAQPLCPGPGYMWTPGYWAYDPADGYYWVPGTWVVAPEPGFLWTPGYWGWSGGFFLWHGGYWGPHVGFYGGVNYGFGYTGVGYDGGYWRGHDFFYNRSVNNVNVTNIRNVYNRTVVNNVTRVSYNGGPGGLNVRPNSAQSAAEHERHIAATSAQQQHQNLARQDRSQFASVNHGKPSVTASARPGEFRAGSAARPAGSQGMTQHGPTHTPPNNARFEHSSTAGGAAHPSRTATPPANRNLERSQARTPNAETRQSHAQPSHAAPARKPANAPRPQVHEEHKASPPAEKKPQGREPEHH